MSTGRHAFCLSKDFSFRDFCTLLLKYLSHNILNTLCTPKAHYIATAFTVRTTIGGQVQVCMDIQLYSVILNAYRLLGLRWGTLVGGLKPSAFKKSFVRFSFPFPYPLETKRKVFFLPPYPALTLFNVLAKFSSESHFAQPCRS